MKSESKSETPRVRALSFKMISSDELPIEAWAREVMWQFHKDLVQRLCDDHDYPALVRLAPGEMTPEAMEVVKQAWQLRRKWVECYKGLAEPSYFVIHSM